MSVVSTLQTQPPMIADELRRQADQFIDLADLEADISRETGPRPEPDEGDFDTDPETEYDHEDDELLEI